MTEVVLVQDIKPENFLEIKDEFNEEEFVDEDMNDAQLIKTEEEKDSTNQEQGSLTVSAAGATDANIQKPGLRQLRPRREAAKKTHVLPDDEESNNVVGPVVLRYRRGRPPKPGTTKTFNCKHCNYRASQKKSLENHVLVQHTNLKPEKCPQCSYACATRPRLLYHIQTKHCDVRRFVCYQCNHNFISKKALENHMTVKHSECKKTYKCPLCSYECALQTYLNQHVKARHTQPDGYKCEYCDFSASVEDHLIKHVQKQHSSQQPFKCNQCSYSAKNKRALTLHVKSMHTEGNAYSCDKCGFVTKVMASLLSHQIRIHSAYKRYRCKHCDFDAVTNKELDEHMREGHSKKLLKCSMCKFRSSNMTAFNEHVRDEHPDTKKNYTCSECGYGCNTLKEFMTTHLKEHEKCKAEGKLKSNPKLQEPDKKDQEYMDTVSFLTEYEEKFETIS